MTNYRRNCYRGRVGTGILCQIHPDSIRRHCVPGQLQAVANVVPGQTLLGIQAVPGTHQNLPTVRYWRRSYRYCCHCCHDGGPDPLGNR